MPGSIGVGGGRGFASHTGITLSRGWTSGDVNFCFSVLKKYASQTNYSRTPLTRTLKGNKNLFELAGFRVIGVD